MKSISFLLCRTIIMLFWLCVVNITIRANGSIVETNEQLRHIFEYTAHPTDFLYDRSAHILDEYYFGTCCSIPTNSDKWFYAYSEMYNSAKDTTRMKSAKEIASHSLLYSADTIPFGIMDYMFCRLRPHIFEDSRDEFFSYDVEHNRIYLPEAFSSMEKGNLVYYVDTFFMASPLLDNSESLTPTFQIGDFLFSDPTSMRQYVNGDFELQIDWGNGNGKQIIKLAEEQNFTIMYPHAGRYTISVFVYYQKKLIKQSLSTINIRNDINQTLLEEQHIVCREQTLYKENGLQVFEYTSEKERNHHNEKIIFVLSGYNPTSLIKKTPHSATQLYQKYIVNGNLQSLLSFDYKFVIIDWMYPNADIRDNARRFAELLNTYIKERNNNEEFVIVGHSMGCLIGRYALLRMEEDGNDSWALYPQEKHFTRLFISNDGPHQGVNIPMSLQCIYGDALGENGYLRDFADFLSVNRVLTIDYAHAGLSGVSVKQMLNRHYETAERVDEITYAYSAHPLFYGFFEDLRNHGNYPKLCKMVALTNGSLDGKGQENMYYDSSAGEFRAYPKSIRQANDQILFMRNQFCFRILGLKYMSDVSVDVRSNPLGSGLLFDMTYTRCKPKLKVYWFGIRVDYTENKYSYSRRGEKLLPYCVSAGGNEYLSRNYANSSWGFFFNLSVFGLDLSSTQGNTFAVNTYAGIPWLFDLSDHFVLHTDGLGFNFVPVNSAIDFSSFDSAEYVTDFSKMDVQQVIEKTPFDVVIGRYGYVEKRYAYNGNHEAIINPVLYDNQNNLWHYSFCEDVPRCLLNAEIGDEDIYLENRIQEWKAELAIPNHIVVSPNMAPYYLYASDNISTSVVKYANPYIRALSDKREYISCCDIQCISNEYPQSNGNAFLLHNYAFDYDYTCNILHQLPRLRTRTIPKFQNVPNEYVTKNQNHICHCLIYTVYGVYVGEGMYDMDCEKLISDNVKSNGIYILSIMDEQRKYSVKILM